MIQADARLVVAVGQPQPGNRNDCTAYTDSKIHRAAAGATVLADGGYPGTGLLISHRRKASQTGLARLEGPRQHPPPQSPRPHRAHLRPHEDLEDPA